MPGTEGILPERPCQRASRTGGRTAAWEELDTGRGGGKVDAIGPAGDGVTAGAGGGTTASVSTGVVKSGSGAGFAPTARSPTFRSPTFRSPTFGSGAAVVGGNDEGDIEPR